MEQKRYFNKVCIDCGIEYIGGTTSKRCPDCWEKDKKFYNKSKVIKADERKEILGENPHCYFCNNRDNLEIHHIDANRRNVERKNLIVLCTHCHRRLHTKIYNIIYSRKIRKIINEHG
jgi:hypothetical protein